MQASLTPLCSFEKLDARDLHSAIQTISKPLNRTVVRVSQLGLGFEAFLRWALQDVETASASPDLEEQRRFSVGALMNARRSLSCLVDQYLLRDGFSFCRDAPHETSEKANLLVRRGLFDSLAARALGRATDRRNRVEHDYEDIPITDVQDTVHIIRTTIENCVAKSDPYWAPALFGFYLGAHSTGARGETHWFHGWADVLFVFARCEVHPWLGVIIPCSITEATVRKVHFSELSCDQLMDALAELETRSMNGYTGYGEDTFCRQLEIAGLNT